MIVLYIILGFAYLFCLITICVLTDQREGAKISEAIIFSVLFTPICGLLYLLLFPRKK
jgi:hypothetical protein